jgi:hypothetical protein
VQAVRDEARHTKKRLMTVIRGAADPGPLEVKP